MGAGEIKAGGAYVGLSTKDQGLSAGLKRAKDMLGGFAKGAAVVGIAGAAAAIGGVAVAVKQFVSMGAALQDVSDRTGLAVSNLSELQFAAEQSGASMEDVEKALRQMAKDGLDPKKFDEVAASIAAIEDPGKRAAKAMEVWGKSGAALLPMVGDLQALRQQARETGNVMGDDAAASAARLDDMFGVLWGTIKHGVAAVGALAAPFLEVAMPAIQKFAQVGIGNMMSVAGFIQTNMATVVGYITTAWQQIYDYAVPIVGALSVAIQAAWEALVEVAATVWGAIGETVMSAWNSITSGTGSALGWLQDTATTAFSAITFAIKNWSLVGRVAFKSSEVAVVQFANQVVYFFGTVMPAWLSWFGDNWREVLTDMVNITETIATNIFKNLSNLWDAIVGLFNGDGFKFEWTPLTEGFKSAIKELPKIAEREMGPLEKSLNAELNAITGEMVNKFDAHQTDFKAKVEKFQAAHADFKLGMGADQTKRAKVAEAAEGALPNKNKSQVLGSFSAAALQASGGPIRAPDAATVKELREHRAIQLRQLKALDDMRAGLTVS